MEDPVIAKKDLPSDEQFQLEDQEVLDETTTPTEFFQNKATDAMRFWSQFINYSLDLDDGTKLKIYRKPATKKELDELRDLSAELAAGGTYKKGKFKAWNPLEARLKEKELEKKKVDVYLRKQDTNQPPTTEELSHVLDSGDLEGIIEAAFAVSMSKWHQGKKG